MVDYTNPNNRSGVKAGAASQAASYDQGLRAYMLKVYNHMGIGLALTGLVALFTYNTPALLQTIATTPLFWVLVVGEVLMVIYLAARVHSMSESTARTVFYAYSAVNGLTFAIVLAAFTGESVARVFFITAATFGAMSLYGYTTKRDLTGFGSFLMMGLIGIVIASIVNIFLKSAGLYYAISYIGVFIFVGLTAYDTQRIKESYYMVGQANLGKAAIMGALSLYLDFINLMVMLLQIMGDRR